MRPIGFSTGALSRGDVATALGMLRGSATTAIELSALRLHELGPLLERLGDLDVSRYAYVSVHAPSRFGRDEEAAVAGALARLVPSGWPIVLHADTIHDPGAWRELGPRILVENMDKRKRGGRTLGELAAVFEALPEASFCFDVGHARQIDRTMNEAYFLLRDLGRRLAQVHVSEVNTESRHDPLSRAAVASFRKIARLVPAGVPLILETPATEAEIAAQAALAEEALSVG
jgi:hypothetical protein